MYYIIVTGGVISGLGKGITASSIGLLLKAYGLNVTSIKIDPYLNYDSGLMSPYQHGECYVLDDGGETDLDLGNYERFLDINLTSRHSLTSGKVFKSVYDKERNGDYLGQTVQMVPHVTDFIQDYILETSKICVDGNKVPDVCIVELGGTVGDHEGSIYYEALSEFSNNHSCCFIHVSLVPIIGVDEIKTKPTQHSIKCIRSLGISPDLLILRCKRMLDENELQKVSKYCKIRDRNNIIVNKDVSSIYEVPKLFMQQNVIERLRLIFGVSSWPMSIPNFAQYNTILKHLSSMNPSVTIGIVGKYTQSQDTYLSLIRALEHASFKVNRKLNIEWIDSSLSISKIKEKIDGVSGVIIPGGFGDRGIDGMIYAAKYCRINSIPLLGLCLGMQIMCIDIDRNLFNHYDATSQEFDDNNTSMHHTVVLSDVQTEMGATMRLGSYTTVLQPNSLALNIYGTQKVDERHRHRYEINEYFLQQLRDTPQHNINISGMDLTGRYAEIIECHKDRFYMGCQFHPEYRSRHTTAHPLFVAFLKSACQGSLTI